MLYIHRNIAIMQSPNLLHLWIDSDNYKSLKMHEIEWINIYSLHFSYDLSKTIKRNPATYLAIRISLSFCSINNTSIPKKDNKTKNSGFYKTNFTVLVFHLCYKSFTITFSFLQIFLHQYKIFDNPRHSLEIPLWDIIMVYIFQWKYILWMLTTRTI